MTPLLRQAQWTLSPVTATRGVDIYRESTGKFIGITFERLLNSVDNRAIMSVKNDVVSRELSA